MPKDHNNDHSHLNLFTVSMFYPRVSKPGEVRQEYEDQVSKVASLRNQIKTHDCFYIFIDLFWPSVTLAKDVVLHEAKVFGQLVTIS